MGKIKLLEQKIETLSYINDISLPNQEGEVEIKIGTGISSKVDYDTTNKICKCVSTVEMKPQNMQVDYKVIISVAGIFSYEDMDNQKELHIAVCEKLFPYLQAITTSFMALTGLPNFNLQEPELSEKDVHQ